MSDKKKRTKAGTELAAEPAVRAAVDELRQLAVRDLFAPPEPVNDVVANLIDLIESLPPAVAPDVLQLLATEGGEKALPVLERLAQSPSAKLALAAVEALGSIRSQRAAELLSRVVETDPSKEMRKEAKRALFRLRSLGIVVEAPPAKPEEVRPERYPIFRSIVSSFDGNGTRVVMFGVERMLGGADRIILLLNVKQGLTHCTGIDRSKRALADEMEGLIREPQHGMLWADAPASYCQQLVQDAMALNPKSSTPIPRGFYYFKNEVGQPPERYERPIVYRELSPLEVKWDPTLLEQSGELLNLHEFDSWAFDPERVGRYYFELQQLQHSAIALPGWSMKERQESLMREFFEEAMTPEEEGRYKFELEETAYLFLRHDRRLDARRTLAAAVAMEDLHGGDVVKIPFMRDLLLKSFALIEQVRRRGQEISASDLGIITPDQFMR